MQSYIVNNLAIKAEQMQEEFTLDNEHGMFHGKAGDYIIHDNGLRKGCKQSDFERQYSMVTDMKAAKDQFMRLMEQGYQEMAEINMGIANEMNHLEVEAEGTLEKYRTTYW